MQYTWIISKTDLPKSMEKLSSTKWSLVPKMLETAALRDGIDIYFFKKLFFSFSSLSFLPVWTGKKKKFLEYRMDSCLSSLPHLCSCYILLFLTSNFILFPLKCLASLTCTIFCPGLCSEDYPWPWFFNMTNCQVLWEDQKKEGIAWWLTIHPPQMNALSLKGHVKPICALPKDIWTGVPVAKKHLKTWIYIF